VVYVKHAYPVSKRTRLDTWLGPILPTLALFWEIGNENEEFSNLIDLFEHINWKLRKKEEESSHLPASIF
jgi:hypothetical protein